MAGVDQHVDRDRALHRFKSELRRYEQIPGAPEVLGKVLELTAGDTAVSTRALAEVVACDPVTSCSSGAACSGSWLCRVCTG